MNFVTGFLEDEKDRHLRPLDRSNIVCGGSSGDSKFCVSAANIYPKRLGLREILVQSVFS
jgi:hypothetical protein